METPLEELIRWTSSLENSTASLTFTEEEFKLIKQLKTRFESLLPKEKSIIIEAIKFGLVKYGDYEDGEEISYDANKIYNETFKTK